MAYTKKKTSEDKPVSETVNTAETDEVSAVDTGVTLVLFPAFSKMSFAKSAQFVLPSQVAWKSP